MSAPVRIDVDLGPRSYPVLIGSGLLGSLGATLREYGLPQTAAFILTNKQVGGLYFERARAALESVGFSKVVRHDIPTSEEGKSWEEFSKTCAALLENFPDTG